MILVCISIYFWLYSDALNHFHKLQQASNSLDWRNNFLYRYYFETCYYRKIPELILLFQIAFKTGFFLVLSIFFGCYILHNI
jgi:hypothetical protein